jgi:hypothetical protein
MRETHKEFWNWFWHKRSGVIIFPGVCGARRLLFELPVMALGVWAWYFYLVSLQGPGRRWLLSMFLNPFGILGVICIAAHGIGINYLRDRLPRKEGLGSRLSLCIPGWVIANYKELNGNDALVKLVRSTGIAAFVMLTLSIVIYNWRLISPGG